MKMVALDMCGMEVVRTVRLFLGSIRCGKPLNLIGQIASGLEDLVAFQTQRCQPASGYEAAFLLCKGMSGMRVFGLLPRQLAIHQSRRTQEFHKLFRQFSRIVHSRYFVLST